ncbi:DUF397 domain-containing protein [Streptomyces syringium]|uniref:DUF397 domain-containing protein n=1 Tax=Streptomyces syringium TaxID=76729 RepID=UPI003439FE69
MSGTSDPIASSVGWFKSSYSNGSGGECLEAAALGVDGTAVRDSKVPGGAVLAFPHGAWADFVGAIRMGRFG